MNELILIHDKCNIVILISSNASPSKLIEVPMFTTRVLWSNGQPLVLSKEILSTKPNNWLQFIPARWTLENKSSSSSVFISHSINPISPFHHINQVGELVSSNHHNHHHLPLLRLLPRGWWTRVGLAPPWPPPRSSPPPSSWTQSSSVSCQCPVSSPVQSRLVGTSYW